MKPIPFTRRELLEINRALHLQSLIDVQANIHMDQGSLDAKQSAQAKVLGALEQALSIT